MAVSVDFIAARSDGLAQPPRNGQTGLIGLKGMNMFPVEISYEGVKYSFTVQRQAPDVFKLSINGQVSGVSVIDTRVFHVSFLS